MKYTTILFDADGTLFDFLRAEDEALRETLRIYNIEPDDEKVSVYSAINDSLWKALERGEIEKNVLRYRRFEMFCEKYNFVCDYKKIAETYTSRLATKGCLIDGARELCDSLSGKVKMYIVTNGIDFVQKGRMAVSGMDKYFEEVFISESIGYEKPDVRYFEFVEKGIPNFSKRDALIVGDSLTSDIKGGIAFGIDTCWYNPNKKSTPENMEITYIADSFDNIYSIITGDGEK